MASSALPNGAVPGTDHESNAIAIIGMGCRFAGSAESPAAFWEMLSEGRSGHGEIPKSRFNADAFNDPRPQRPGSTPVNSGYFISDDIREFDSSFFGIMPLEAKAMDPHQRNILEVAYETFESAGLTLEQLSGSRTGVYVGNFSWTFADHMLREPEFKADYEWIGKSVSIISNRISYCFNLKGPSVTLDTACSSSMYALHLAVSALKTEEIDYAFVGGTNLMMTVEAMLDTSHAGLLSPRGVCNTFDASADGYGRGDGIAGIMLKRLPEAVQDHDPIRSVIRGTALNANGKSTSGISHPDPYSQAECIRLAYKHAANLRPEETDYVECHGTGTAVGDPLEVAALTMAFGSRISESPRWIGSVKTNVGHTEAASALASIIKSALVLEKRVIPPTVGVKQLSPEIHTMCKTYNIKVATEKTPWPTQRTPRASVNSFGFGGANAHAVLESVEGLYPGYFEKNMTSPTLSAVNDELLVQSNCRVLRKNFLLPVSAHSEASLNPQISSIKSSIRRYKVADLAYTLSCRRTHLPERAFLLASTDGSLDASSPLRKRLRSKDPLKIIYIFTGQGAQWPQMGMELIQRFPSFRSTIKHLECVLRSLKCAPSWNLEAALLAEPSSSDINDAGQSQTLCTAVQVAMVKLLDSWGIKPSATIGHSSGEIAAAFTSGRISQEEAIIIAYCRGQAIIASKERGAMLAVGLSSEATEAHIAALGRTRKELVIGCYNSPGSVTVSGSLESTAALKSRLDAQGVFVRELRTGQNAYHSAYMRSIGEYYENLMLSSMEEFRTRSPKKPKINMVSTLTSQDMEQTIELRYWRSNLESPVLFDQALRRLLVNEFDSTCIIQAIEISPHNALAGPVREIVAQAGMSDTVVYSPTLRRHQDGEQGLLRMAGELYLHGYPLNLEQVNSPEILTPTGDISLLRGRFTLDLPRYAWNHETLQWVSNRWSEEWRFRQHRRHDLLGSILPGSTRNPRIWRNILRVVDVPWLEDHKVGNSIVFPAAGYFAMAIEAVTQTVDDHLASQNPAYAKFSELEGYSFTNVAIKTALILSGQNPETLFTLSPVQWSLATQAAGMYEFKITSFVSGKWSENCTGTIELRVHKEIETESLLDSSRLRVADTSEWYRALAKVGLIYGDSFSGLAEIRGTAGGAMAMTSLFPTAISMPLESSYVIHPATFDTCLQLALVACYGGDHDSVSKAYLPVFAEKVDVWISKRDLPAHGTIQATGSPLGLKSAYVNSQLRTTDGEILIDIRNFKCTSSELETLAKASNQSRHPYYRELWKPVLSYLASTDIEELYGVSSMDGPGIAAQYNSLERLSFLAILGTLQRYGDIIPQKSDELGTTHLHHYVSWMRSEVEKVRSGKWTPSSVLGTMQMGSEEREAEIIKLHENLLSCGICDSNLIKAHYENIGVVLRGEGSALEHLTADVHLREFYRDGFGHRGAYAQVRNLADLLGHENTGLKILEIGAGTGGVTRVVLEALDGDTIFKRYKSYTFTDISAGFFPAAKLELRQYHGLTFQTLDIEKHPGEQGYDMGSFDLVVAANVLHATSDVSQALRHARSLLKPNGRFLLLENTKRNLESGFIFGSLPGWWLNTDNGKRSSPLLPAAEWCTFLREEGLDSISVLRDYQEPYDITSVILASATQPSVLSHSSSEASWVNISNSEDVTKVTPSDQNTPATTYIVSRHQTSQFLDVLRIAASTQQLPVKHVSYEQIAFPSDASVILISEFEEPLLSSLNGEELRALQNLLNTAASILWITTGSLLEGQRPQFAMSHGLARVIRSEHPSLRLVTLDLDLKSTTDANALAFAAERVVRKQLEIRWSIENASPILETTLWEKDGIPHSSRVVPDRKLNTDATRVFLGEKTYAPLGSMPLRVDIENPGLFDSIYFKEDTRVGTILPPDCVEIKVEAVGVNMKDLVNFMGRFDQDFFSCEAGGVITMIGSGVSELQVGDRVICLCKGDYGTHVRTPAALCVKLLETESITETVTMPLVYATVIYCLLDISRLMPNMSVLIHAAAGGVGIAAIEFARHIGAEIFATVSSPEKRAYLCNTYGISDDHIFYSRDKSFASGVKRMTNGRGVDVTLSSVTHELLHETVDCLAPLGTHVEIGMRDILDHGRLDMSLFKGSRRFCHYYLFDFAANAPGEITRTLQAMMGLYRERRIKALPYRLFDVADLEKALRYFSEGKHIGKIVIKYNNPASIVRFQPRYERLQLRPDVTYLLVGCLGGLGRSLASFMVQRGARNLVFLSRSGGDSPIARKLLKDLQAAGANIYIQRGDVSVEDDVRAAIALAKYPVRGVVNAAMQLEDEYFLRMTPEKWQSSIRPKVHGSLNLHRVLSNKPLDFFVMTSSMAAVFGNEAQGNYAAGNYFLDSLARHRRSQGLVATSVALGRMAGIGYVAEADREDTVAILERGGGYAFSEKDFLSVMETAMCDATQPGTLDGAALITGFEPAKMQDLQEKGTFSGHAPWLNDVRFSCIKSALEELSAGGSSGMARGKIRLLEQVKAARGADGEEAGFGVLRNEFLAKFGSVIGLAVGEIDGSKAMSDYGVDSMVASELRSWTFKELSVDYPLLELLTPTLSIQQTAERMYSRLS